MDKLEHLKGAQKSLETALKGLMDLLTDNNKKLDAQSQLTDKMYVALTNHVKDDKDWREEIKKFMDRIYKCIWGNGVPGMKAQMLIQWIIGIGLIGAVAYMYIMHLPK